LPHFAAPRLLAAGPHWQSARASCAVTVGNFDGVHLGHAAIVARLLEAGRRLGLPTAALTFDPHPARILRPGAAPAALSTPDRRAGLLLDLGVDAVLVQPVDREFLALSATAFYREVLRGAVGAAAVVEGPDFRFGADRQGDLALLDSLAAADGVEVITVAPLERGGEAVSSSRIRRLIGAGEIEATSGLLTAPYRIEGLVVHGKARGRTLGFPTANLEGIATLLPAAGVYAGLAHPPALSGGAGGKPHSPYPAAIHIGPNVTFGAAGVTVEVHCIGFDGDLYGRRLDVDFLARLRDTRRFDSLDDLKAQLATDVARAGAVAAGFTSSSSG
jgi:riboflavin kinase/FMN adenylyltransferase